MTKVLIGVPAQDQSYTDFAFDLAQLVGYTTAMRPDVTLTLVMVKGTLLTSQRQNVVRYALDDQADYILWLDSDMRFPKDALIRLLEHNQDIVAADYSTRRLPCIPTSEKYGEGLVMPSPEAEGLFETSRIGMGLMLTRVDVFRQLERPWFSIGWSPKANDYVGEDVYFCAQARKAGFTVWQDLKLSNETGHCGQFTYKMAHARQGVRDDEEITPDGADDVR